MHSLYRYLTTYPALVSVTIPTLLSIIILWPIRKSLTFKDAIGWAAATALTVVSHAWYVTGGEVYMLFIPFFALHCLSIAMLTRVKHEVRLVAWTYLSILAASIIAAWIGHDMSKVVIEPFYAIVGYHGWRDLLLIIPVTTYISIKFVTSYKQA